jgi:tetratricopeptide (TPR) repeat protein
MASKRSSRETLVLAAAAVLTIWLYTASLGGPFVFDDTSNILENRPIHITAFSAEALYDAAFKSPIPSRPVAYLSFALNHLFSGTNVVGYRLINVLIHIANACLLYALARLTLRTPALRSQAASAGAVACAAAVLWLLHPLHTQSVAYIVQRMTSLATLFYLLSLACYAGARLAEEKGRRRLLWAGCIASGILALGTKEIAATLPLFILLYEWYFFQELDRRWLRRRLPLLAGVVAATLLIGWGFLGFRNPIESIFAGYAGKAFGAEHRLLTQLRVVVFYISLLFYPAASRLNLDHDISVSLSLIEPPATLLSLIVLAAIAGAAVILARRRPLGSFAILWFLGNLVIESSVIGLEAIFEHRTYLPSVFPAIAIVALGARVITHRKTAAALVVLTAALFSVSTWERTQVWGDDVALWRDSAEKSPRKARPFNNLGSALAERERFEEAAAVLARAVALKPDFGDARYNLGYVLVRLGQMEAGTRELLEAVRLEPENYLAHNNLGVAYLLQENYRDAVRHFEEALRLKPDFASAGNNLGVALKNLGELDRAVARLREVIRLNPGYAEAWNNLGLTLQEQGLTAEAAESFRRALRIAPAYTVARRNLEQLEKGETPLLK